MLKVVFMGSPEFAAVALRALVPAHEVVLAVAQPDKPAGRGKRMLAPAVKRVAEAAGVAVAQPKSARTDEFRSLLERTGADVGVVVAYGKILPAPVLQAFPHGCLNVHASLLPAYRGAAPIQWAVINGETETGITIMQLDEGMDTGPMLLKRALPIEPTDTAGSLAERLAPIGAELVLEALSRVEAGGVEATAQDDSRASSAPMLRKPDGVIDWTRSAISVRDRIRGVDPWPGASTALAGSALKLFGARVAVGSGSPGQVLAVDDRGLVVACGERACAIADIQGPGKRRMSAGEFVRGKPIPPGTILGS
jgi:methionyl-tRNA formyltransferase